jgi:hypothetical protein
MDKVRVGLLAFPYHDGRISSGSSIVCERLTTHLVSAKKLRVVERRLVQKLLEEQKLNETGVIDQATAKEMGRVLGVDILITGTLIDLAGDRTEVNARALKSDTGEVIAASNAVIERIWTDTPRRPERVFNRAPEPDKEDHSEKKSDEEPMRVGYPAARPMGRR